MKVNTKKMKVVESKNTLGNAEETPNKENSFRNELTEQRPILKSPFVAVRNEEIWVIRCGKYKLEAQLTSFEECEKYVEENLWELIGVFVTTVVEWNNELNKTNK